MRRFQYKAGDLWQHLETEAVWVVTLRATAAISGKRPGMLLTVSQSTGQSPAAKNYLTQNVNTVEVEKLSFKENSKKP